MQYGQRPTQALLQADVGGENGGRWLVAVLNQAPKRGNDIHLHLRNRHSFRRLAATIAGYSKAVTFRRATKPGAQFS